MTVFVGIDPGLTGAVAILWPDADPEVVDTPTTRVGKGNDYLAASMANILASVKLACMGRAGERVAAALEQGIAMPKQSSSSTFKTGRGGGLWEGILAGLGIPYELVTPRRWKLALGMPIGADKSASRLYAQRLFPAVADRLARVKDDGRAEALLIAEWRRRQESPQQAPDGVAVPDGVAERNAPESAS